MHMLQRLELSTVLAVLSLVNLLLSVGCSSHEQNQGASHKAIKENVNKVSPPISDIVLHGILSWASMGFLMPVGIVVIRMLNKEDCGQRKLRLLIYFHAILQMLAVLLATAGGVLSLKSFDNSFNNSHQRIGLALYGAIWVQALIGFRRPKRGSKGRSAWYCCHWILGTLVSLLGIFNIYTGLKAYQKRTARSAGLWNFLFTAEVSLLAFFYLFQDKWEYFQKQGVVSGTDPSAPSNQVLPQRDNQKEVLVEPGRKSNSLGNYFAKTNALRKLFQLT